MHGPQSDLSFFLVKKVNYAIQESCLMKHIVMLGLIGLFSSYSFAGNLDCHNYSMTFKNIEYQRIALAKTANNLVNQHYLDQHDYTMLFKTAHNAKRYYLGHWIDQNQAKSYQMSINEYFKTNKIKNFKINDIRTKGSYTSALGEVCVMESKAEYVLMDIPYQMRYDSLYLRHNQNKGRWYLYNYIGIESKKDMTEFFPEFPTNIQLNAVEYNGQNFAEIVEQQSRRYYEYHSIPLSVEAENNIIKTKKRNLSLLRKNGFIE
ncbi:hypothetical protein [Acinetobacter rudis]|uniref:hypothetical protein n=1 Tax=Acinetobacter rudis TaxID=632955 RepID=UPI00333F24BE